MPLKADDLSDLITDIAQLASAMDAESSGAPTARRILEQAAQPIHQQMKSNASSDPKIESGKLHGAINVGDVKRRRNGGQRITIGVHRKTGTKRTTTRRMLSMATVVPVQLPHIRISVLRMTRDRMKPMKSSVTDYAMQSTIQPNGGNYLWLLPQLLLLFLPLSV